jgi:EAL domain-containing protein (putative c-di-GMP-specific phosphodiesterase class I)
VQISLSIGICPFAADIGDAASMLVQADLALYRSKEEGRNQYRFHSSELDQEVRERVTLGAELRAAIDRNELTLDYQAQVDLSSRRIVGMEALVRWNHPTRGMLLPDAFLPVAERTGAIVPLGRWVLDRACRQLSQWRQEGIGPEVIAVNVSLSQLKRGADFVAEVLEIVSRWQLQASEIEFDVTEGTLAQLKWTQNDVLPRLRKLGIKIAIDDFGSEYSSFDYVKAFSVNHLKVSRSYISKSERDPEGAAAVAAIFNYARDIGVGVIAQGVETEQQFQLLNSAAPGSQGQGFHFSAAVNAEEAGRLLASGHIPAATRVADAPICAADMRFGARICGR